MEFQNAEYVAAYFDGRTTFFKRSESHSFSYFGGSLDLHSGEVIPSFEIHRILTIHFADIPGFKQLPVFAVPLFYGMRHNGCAMSYKVISNSKIEMIEIYPPEPQINWPYQNYPALLPYVPLMVSRVILSSYEDFSSMFWQEPPIDSPDKLIVLFPSPPPMGVSLWGLDGDMGGVQIVFEYDTSSKIISVSNQCD